MFRPLLRLAPLAGLFLAGACVAVGDRPAPHRRTSHTQPASAVDTNALLRQTVWKGTLVAAPTNAPRTILAVLSREERLSPPRLPIRTDDTVLAARIRELLGRKHTAVILQARIDPDCATLHATEILSLPEEHPSERASHRTGDAAIGIGR